jgi:hypothetical protein
MNIKTVDKVLRAGKSDDFFGPRSYVTVSIPLSRLPEPPPSCPSFGRTGGLSGHFIRRQGDHRIMTVFSEVFCDTKPEGEPKDGDGWGFVEDDGDGGFSWWEGIERWWKAAKREADDTFIKDVPLPLATIGAYRAFEQWKDRYSGHKPIGIDNFDAFVEAGQYARAIYPDVRRSKLMLTFGVKHFYPETRAAFVRCLTDALTLSEKTGFGAVLLWKPVVH